MNSFVSDAEDTAANLIVSLTTGTTHLVLPSSARPVETEAEQTYAATGVIYHHRKDMPSLEELLAEHRVLTAVWERGGQSPWRIAGATAIAVSITTVGWVFFASGVATAGLHVNAWIGLMVGLGGLGLIATLIMALRD